MRGQEAKNKLPTSPTLAQRAPSVHQGAFEYDSTTALVMPVL